MTDTWIILGATSTIAKAFLRRQAEAGHGLILAGRDKADLAATAADSIARGAAFADVAIFDARNPTTFQPIIDRAHRLSGMLNAAVFVGSMPDQADIDADPALIDGTITDSFTGPARFLTLLAPLMEERGGGAIVGVGSVAGDRGRLGNYVYGAAKAGFATYLSGLRNRLARSGVHVMTVKPGPVDTAMTWGLPSMPFMATPEAVADDIAKGLRKGRNVIYTAGIWRIIMLVIRSVPEPIFKKLKI
jgi:short-subunit dehydrogenase